MYESIFIILKYIYFGTITVAAIVALINRGADNYINKKVRQYLWVLVIVELSIQFVRYKLKINSNIHLIIYEVFGIFEYYIIADIFNYYLNSRGSNLVKVSSIIYGLLTLGNIFYLEEYLVFNYMFLVRCLVFMYSSLAYFYYVYQVEELLDLKKNPIFWISIGFFVFSAGSIFIKGLGYEIQKINRDLAYSVYTLNSILNIYLYVMVFIGLLCSRRNTGSYS